VETPASFEARAAPPPYPAPIKKEKLFFFADNEGLCVTIPQSFFLQTPSPEFQAATLANIRSTFGVGSASDKFYQQVFDLYNAAPRSDAGNTGLRYTW
jgi:hypothetical protein